MNWEKKRIFDIVAHIAHRKLTIALSKMASVRVRESDFKAIEGLGGYWLQDMSNPFRPEDFAGVFVDFAGIKTLFPQIMFSSLQASVGDFLFFLLRDIVFFLTYRMYGIEISFKITQCSSVAGWTTWNMERAGEDVANFAAFYSTVSEDPARPLLAVVLSSFRIQHLSRVLAYSELMEEIEVRFLAKHNEIANFVEEESRLNRLIEVAMAINAPPDGGEEQLFSTDGLDLLFGNVFFKPDWGFCLTGVVPHERMFPYTESLFGDELSRTYQLKTTLIIGPKIDFVDTGDNELPLVHISSSSGEMVDWFDKIKMHLQNVISRLWRDKMIVSIWRENNEGAHNRRLGKYIVLRYEKEDFSINVELPLVTLNLFMKQMIPEERLQDMRALKEDLIYYMVEISSILERKMDETPGLSALLMKSFSNRFTAMAPEDLILFGRDGIKKILAGVYNRFFESGMRNSGAIGTARVLSFYLDKCGQDWFDRHLGPVVPDRVKQWMQTYGQESTQDGEDIGRIVADVCLNLFFDGQLEIPASLQQYAVEFIEYENNQAQALAEKKLKNSGLLARIQELNEDQLNRVLSGFPREQGAVLAGAMPVLAEQMPGRWQKDYFRIYQKKADLHPGFPPDHRHLHKILVSLKHEIDRAYPEQKEI